MDDLRSVIHLSFSLIFKRFTSWGKIRQNLYAISSFLENSLCTNVGKNTDVGLYCVYYCWQGSLCGNILDLFQLFAFSVFFNHLVMSVHSLHTDKRLYIEGMLCHRKNISICKKTYLEKCCYNLCWIWPSTVYMIGHRMALCLKLEKFATYWALLFYKLLHWRDCREMHCNSMYELNFKCAWTTFSYFSATVIYEEPTVQQLCTGYKYCTFLDV